MILNQPTPTASTGRGEAMSTTNNHAIPGAIKALAEKAMTEMGDKERVCFLQGLSLGLRMAARAMTDTVTGIRNADLPISHIAATVREFQG
jgi:hypothetical protein